MSRILAEFYLEDGKTTFLAEVPEPINESAIEEVTILDEQFYRAKQSFEAALDQVVPVASVAMERFKSGLTTPADGLELKFGVNLSVDAGAFLASLGGEVTFEVTVKWGK